MINILIDCANKEIRVDKDGEQYYYAKCRQNLATAAIVAWQIVHDLSHELNESTIISYFGITLDGEEKNTKVNIGTQAFCLLMDNFGGVNDIVTSQTNLAIQLLIHGIELQTNLINTNK